MDLRDTTKKKHSVLEESKLDVLLLSKLLEGVIHDILQNKSYPKNIKSHLQNFNAASGGLHYNV